MEQIKFDESLSQLPKRLSVFDNRIGRYCGYVSTTRGITLKTLSGSLFLHRNFIYKLLYQPDRVTDDDLEQLVSSLRQG
jgi:hypothetical protein